MNLTLNDASDWEISDEEVLRRCDTRVAPRTFLGEQYLPDGTVCNTESNVDKLRDAAELMERKLGGEGALTFRQFASLVGLCAFMAHTVDLRINHFCSLMRAYSAIFARVTGWDDPVGHIEDGPLAELRHMIRVLVRNEPVTLPVIVRPSMGLSDYSAVAILDASAAAWGAYVLFPQAPRPRAVMLRQRWAVKMGSSAHSKPRAALRVLRFIVARGAAQRVALVTDRKAMALAQCRWHSNFNGHGRTFWLNLLYKELNDALPNAEVFYVEGHRNPADGPSRDPNTRLKLDVLEDAQLFFPPLHWFYHPFAEHDREFWQV